jgi:predicted Zn-dependent protease
VRSSSNEKFDEFGETYVAGDIPREALEDIGVPANHIDLTAVRDSDSQIDVKWLIRIARGLRKSPGYTLILTDRDLRIRGLCSAMGYADRRSKVAIVSTSRLNSNGSVGLLVDRVRNVMAHELGHLKGLRHCADQRCVMRPVFDASQLNERPQQLCPRCSAGGRGVLRHFFGVVVAAAIATAFVLSADLAASVLLGDQLQFPFS